jgi:hypothetical protein
MNQGSPNSWGSDYWMSRAARLGFTDAFQIPRIGVRISNEQIQLGTWDLTKGTRLIGWDRVP